MVQKDTHTKFFIAREARKHFRRSRITWFLKNARNFQMVREVEKDIAEERVWAPPTKRQGQPHPHPLPAKPSTDTGQVCSCEVIACSGNR